MYLQITQKCNMSCEHCCYRSTMNGKHMTRKVWNRALKWAKEAGIEYVAIGGGEPTLHPHFWEIFGTCLGNFEVWLATNGSQTETAITLAGLAKKGVIGCALSQDYYHDPIDERVIEAFTNESTGFTDRRNPDDQREIRNVLERGNGDDRYLSVFRNPEDGGYEDNCPCATLFIDVNGKIKPCGCLDAPIVGDIFKGFTMKVNDENGYILFSADDCWRNNRDLFTNKDLTSQKKAVE